MEITKPSDFQEPESWCREQGRPVFPSVKSFYYHTQPIQRELIEAGAMAKVGARIYLHKTRFWPEYQRIVASAMAHAEAA